MPCESCLATHQMVHLNTRKSATLIQSWIGPRTWKCTKLPRTKWQEISKEKPGRQREGNTRKDTVNQDCAVTNTSSDQQGHEKLSRTTEVTWTMPKKGLLQKGIGIDIHTPLYKQSKLTSQWQRNSHQTSEEIGWNKVCKLAVVSLRKTWARKQNPKETKIRKTQESKRTG